MWVAVVWLVVGVCECRGAERARSYTWGDALIDPHALGPDGQPYPRELVNRLYAEGELGPPGRGARQGRTLHATLDPDTTRTRLLHQYHLANQHQPANDGRSMSTSPVSENFVNMAAAVKSSTSTVSSSSTSSSSSSCPPAPPPRLCPTRYNTTAPMYGISLTSGQPVTIVQKFPDLLQQVIFEVCESETCEVLQGSCVQTYVPYLFLVIPLGPVTLTGQDYVLVESGCACQPKFSQASTRPSPVDALPGLQ